jgi:hypothetical protein
MVLRSNVGLIVKKSRNAFVIVCYLPGVDERIEAQSSRLIQTQTKTLLGPVLSLCNQPLLTPHSIAIVVPCTCFVSEPIHEAALDRDVNRCSAARV